MGIKITTDEQSNAGKHYPRLMIGTSGTTVALFTERGCATVLQACGLLSVGQVVRDFSMDDFREFHGSITLQNE
jgi:hypothetical protein